MTRPHPKLVLKAILMSTVQFVHTTCIVVLLVVEIIISIFVLGVYAYLEATGLYPGQVARLVTPSFNKGPLIDNCMHFQFNCYGAHRASLKVYGKALENLLYIWESRGFCLNGWLSLEFTIPDFMSQILFEATRGGAFFDEDEGDLCLDNINIKDGACAG